MQLKQETRLRLILHKRPGASPSPLRRDTAIRDELQCCGPSAVMHTAYREQLGRQSPGQHEQSQQCCTSVAPATRAGTAI